MKQSARGWGLRRAYSGLALSGLLCLAPLQAADSLPGSWQWRLPAGFAAPVVPADNPMSQAKVELGRYLFYEKRLSGNGKLMCASCHIQRLAFTDGRPVSRGSTGEYTARSAQALMNVAWNASYTWANPALTSLETQMSVPLFGENPVEMGVNDSNKQRVLQRLQADKRYRQLFRQAFAQDAAPISWRNIIRAIASFERSMVSGNARYDRYLQGRARLSAAELRGKDLFFGEKAECFHCHGGFNFSDQTVSVKTRLEEMLFHNTGLYNLDGKGAFPEGNRGVYELTGLAEDMGKFRAPSLRNIAVTAPYMHDGSLKDLPSVLAFYAAGGRKLAHGKYQGDGRLNPYKSELIGNIELNRQEQQDIIAFLGTLTEQEFLHQRALADPFRR